MTIRAMWRICPKCHRKYDWNPSIGVISCPYCRKRENKKGILGFFFGKKGEKGSDEIAIEAEPIGEEVEPMGE